MKYKKKSLGDILRSPQSVFTFKEIAFIWGETDTKALISGINYYIRKGELYRIRKGIYAKDSKYDRLEAATKIYTPSYVSLESVLAKEGIIFQFYKQIFLVSYLTREINADGQVYSYRKIKDSILTNTTGILLENNRSIASPERAFLDTLYLNDDYHFDNLSPINWDKVQDILSAFENKKLMKDKVNKYYHAFKHSGS